MSLYANSLACLSIKDPKETSGANEYNTLVGLPYCELSNEQERMRLLTGLTCGQ